MKRMKNLIAQVGLFRAVWILLYWTDKRIENRFK
jgi:hypothetical protein